MEARDAEGDFVLVIIEEHRWFIVEVELAMIQKCRVFGYLTVEFGGCIDFGFARRDKWRCERRRIGRFGSRNR